MSSKIKVDTIENVAGSGNVSLGSGHNLVVPGNITGSGTATITGDLAVNTNKIFVDASTDYIGMGTTSPATATGGGIDIHRNGGSSVRIDDTTNSVTGELQVYSAGLNLATVTNHNLVLSTNNTSRMTIDGSGRVFKPNQPAFLATGNNSNYITTSPVPFPTVVYNIGSHYNNSNYTFTAPVAGRYFFHAHMGLVTGGSGNSIYPWFSVNGSQQQYSYSNFAGTWYSTGHLTCILNLSANDTVKITVSLSSATYYNGANETRFMGYLLG